jgi:hypothetical protein
MLRESGQSALTNAEGTFTLYVPTETPVTIVLTAAGFADTVEQTFIVHRATQRVFLMATDVQYDYLSSFAGALTGGGVIFVQINTTSDCTYVGAVLSVSPNSGVLAYVNNLGVPDLSYTSLQADAPYGYFLSASGYLLPEIMVDPDAVSGDNVLCAQAPWPVDDGTLSIEGAIDVQPGAFHDVSVFIH